MVSGGQRDWKKLNLVSAPREPPSQL